MTRRIVLCAAISLALIFATATATASGAASVRILAPGDGSLVTGSTVHVVIASPARPRLWLETRELTSSLRRSGGRWVADISSAALGGAGPHHLYASLGAGFSGVRFVLGRRVRSLLAFPGPGVLQAAGSVAVRLRLGASESTVRGWLNGRPLALGQGPFPPGAQSIRLGPDDGLRFGRNQLTMLTFKDSGSYDRQSVSIMVSRTDPLAGAGPDLSGVSGHPLSFSARSSRAARRGDRLAFQWQIASAPRGSRARLLRAGSVAPRLKPDLPGRYVLRLSVSERTANGRGRLLGRAADFATVDARPDDPPLGVPLETLDDQGQVLVDDQPLAGTGGEGLNLVVLARSDRTLERPAKNYGRDAASLAALRAAVGSLRAKGATNLLAVISGPAGDAPDSQELRSLVDSLGDIGVSLSPTAHAALADGEAFSAIGVPGSPAGSGFVNVLSQFSTNPSKDAPSGDLRGYLEYNEGFSEYGFVFSDYPPFDTSAARTPRSNTMVVGGQSYTQQFDSDVPAGASGFALLALDRTSLQPIRTFDSNVAIPTTNAGSAAQDGSGQQELAGAIGAAVGSNALVLLQSIGNPQPTTTEWNGLARAVEEVGGTGAVFNELDGNGGYALVGGKDLQPSEVASYLNHRRVYPEARLAGVLGRDHGAAFQALLADPAGNVAQQLFAVAYQEQQEFPSFAATPEMPNLPAADAYITQQDLGFKTDTDPRHRYWENFHADWAGKNAKLNCAKYPAGHGFSQAEYEQVCDQLKLEITDVGSVEKYIGLLQNLFRNGTEAYIDLQDIGRTIQGKIQPADATTNADTVLLISKVLGVGSKAAGGAGEPIGAVASVLSVAGNVMTPDGSPILGALQTKVNDLASQTLTRFREARDTLSVIGKILVSDWGKLGAAASNIDGPWRYPAPDTQLTTAFRKGVKQWYYEQLLPVAWDVYTLTADPRHGINNARDWICSISGPRITYDYKPFQAESDLGQLRPITGFSSDPSRKPPVAPNQPTILALGRSFIPTSGFTASPPPADLLDPLFQPLDQNPDSNKLGLFPELLYTHGFSIRTPPKGPDSGQNCK